MAKLKFYESFAKSIDKTGWSKNHISTEFDINRGVLYKYLDGRLKIPQEIFHKMIDVMNISYTERLNLIDLFYKELYGNAKYQRIMALEQIFKNLDSACIPDDSLSAYLGKFNFTSLKNNGKLYLHTEYELLEAVRYLFEKVPSGKILTNYPYSQSKFDDTVYSCFLKNPCFDITHLLYFKNDGGSLENLKNIFGSLRWLRYQVNPLCCFNGSELKSNALFPCFFAIDSYCLFFNAEFSQGFVCRDADMFQYIEEYVSDLEHNKATRLAIFPQDIIELKNAVSGNVEENIEMCLRRWPCLAPIADTEFINAVAREDLPDREHFVALAIEHYANALGVEYEKFIFSQTGLRKFAETGKIDEIPGFFIHKAPPEQRIRYFEKLIELNKAKRLKILNDAQFDWPDTIPMEVLDKLIRTYGEFVNVPEDMKSSGNFIIHIDDGQIYEDMLDFSKYMYFTKSFYTEMGTESFLKSLIQFCS